MSFKGFKHTEECKREARERMKGNKRGFRFQKGHKINVGCKRSLETIERMKTANNKGWFKKGHKINIGNKWNINKKLSEKTKRKMSFAQKGSKGSNWRGGITPLEHMIRGSFWYSKWRHNIYERDNYTCQNQGCNYKGLNVIAHHNKISFEKILQEFLIEYDQFSPIEDKETLLRLTIKYEPFWNIDNGVTYCKRCHNKIHKYIEK